MVSGASKRLKFPTPVEKRDSQSEDVLALREKFVSQRTKFLTSRPKLPTRSGVIVTPSDF
jgi:hypothetical protein